MSSRSASGLTPPFRMQSVSCTSQANASRFGWPFVPSKRSLASASSHGPVLRHVNPTICSFGRLNTRVAAGRMWAAPAVNKSYRCNRPAANGRAIACPTKGVQFTNYCMHWAYFMNNPEQIAIASCRCIGTTFRNGSREILRNNRASIHRTHSSMIIHRSCTMDGRSLPRTRRSRR